MLSSQPAHPIRLSNPMFPSKRLVASYPLVDSMTEKVHTISSLAFVASGTHFIAGARNTIACFDVSRDGSEPVVRHRTDNGRMGTGRKGASGFRGIVSALDISSVGILAAGTFTGCLALYSAEGRGGVSAQWREAQESQGVLGGAGITQVRWSPCGRYLYTGSRNCERIVVYDVRIAGRELALLTGRQSSTSQRIDFDLAPSENGGHDVWSGGTDGLVQIWQDPYQAQGLTSATDTWRAHGGELLALQHSFSD